MRVILIYASQLRDRGNVRPCGADARDGPRRDCPPAAPSLTLRERPSDQPEKQQVEGVEQIEEVFHTASAPAVVQQEARHADDGVHLHPVVVDEAVCSGERRADRELRHAGVTRKVQSADQQDAEGVVVNVKRQRQPGAADRARDEQDAPREARRGLKRHCPGRNHISTHTPLAGRDVVRS